MPYSMASPIGACARRLDQTEKPSTPRPELMTSSEFSRASCRGTNELLLVDTAESGRRRSPSERRKVADPAARRPGSIRERPGGAGGRGRRGTKLFRHLQDRRSLGDCSARLPHIVIDPGPHDGADQLHPFEPDERTCRSGFAHLRPIRRATGRNETCRAQETPAPARAAPHLSYLGTRS
jgi:hypothetical protein